MLERLQTHPNKGNDGHSLPLEPCFIIVAAPPLICVLESLTGFLPCPEVLPLTKVLTSTSVLTHVHFMLRDPRVLSFGYHSSPVTTCLLLDCWLLAIWAWPAASAAGWKRAGGTIWMSLLELCFFLKTELQVSDVRSKHIFTPGALLCWTALASKTQRLRVDNPSDCSSLS